MKSSIIWLSQALAAMAAPRILESQMQFPKDIKPQNALKIEDIAPVLRKDSKRMRFTYGPYKLNAAGGTKTLGDGKSMDPDGTGYTHLLGADFPRDITVIDTNTIIADATGKKLTLSSNIYDHHHIFTDVMRLPDPFLACGEGKDQKPLPSIPTSILMASATEDLQFRYTTDDGKFKSGYYVAKNDVLVYSGDFVNYNKEEKEIYTVSEVEFLPGKVDGFRPAALEILGLNQCTQGIKSATGIEAPKDKKQFSLGGEKMTILKDGYFVKSRGHLHDGGVDIVLKINDKAVCTSVAKYGGEGHTTTLNGKTWDTLAEMTECQEILPVKKGDVMFLEARYDLEAHPQRQHAASGGMAEAMALWLPTFAEA